MLTEPVTNAVDECAEVVRNVCDIANDAIRNRMCADFASTEARYNQMDCTEKVMFVANLAKDTKSGRTKCHGDWNGWGEFKQRAFTTGQEGTDKVKADLQIAIESGNWDEVRSLGAAMAQRKCLDSLPDTCQKKLPVPALWCVREACIAVFLIHMRIRREWYDMIKDTDTDGAASSTDNAFDLMCCWDVAEGCLCSNPTSKTKYYEEVEWPDLWVYDKLNPGGGSSRAGT